MNLFGQLAIIMQTRQINLKDVFSYPISIYPLSLSICFIRKTNKASLLQSFEKNVQPGVIRQDTTIVVNVLDGMALIRKMKVRDINFSQLAKQIFQHALSITPKPARTDLVFDVYKKNSIKDAERVRSTGDIRFQVIHDELPIKQWDHFCHALITKKS